MRAFRCMVIYLDVLAPLKRISLGFQQEIHDPDKAVRRIQKFTWSMTKLKLFTDNTIENRTIPTQMNKLLNFVENRNGTYFYKGIKLTKFEMSKDDVSDIFATTIASITNFTESRLHELASQPMFKNLVFLSIRYLNLAD